jgi:hypothetical protein
MEKSGRNEPETVVGITGICNKVQNQAAKLKAFKISS